MGNPFERAGNPKAEDGPTSEGVNWENFANSEGFLSKIAKSPRAKRMLKGLAILSGLVVLNAAMPENVEAREKFPRGSNYRTGNPRVDIQRFADGGIQRRAAKREFDRLNNQRIRAEERAEEERGAAQAEKEIFENGRPRYTSLGRRSSDHLISGPYAKGYFRVVRQWERAMNNAARRNARESGKILGQQRFEEQVERENMDPADKSLEDFSAGDALGPVLDFLRGGRK